MSEHVCSLPDGSYVSVPSPLGKIKSMTKGSEVEWSTADFFHTSHRCQPTWQHTLSVTLWGGVNNSSASGCLISVLIWETIDLNRMKLMFEACKTRNHLWSHLLKRGPITSLKEITVFTISCSYSSEVHMVYFCLSTESPDSSMPTILLSFS